MILCDRHGARKHSQYRLNRPLTQARNIVTMRRARDLGDTEALIDLVSEKAKQMTAVEVTSIRSRESRTPGLIHVTATERKNNA